MGSGKGKSKDDKGSNKDKGKDKDDKGSNKGEKRTRGARSGHAVHIIEQFRGWEDLWIVYVDEDDNINHVKRKIANVMWRPNEGKMVLSYQSEILKDTLKVRDYFDKKESRLYLSWAE